LISVGFAGILLSTVLGVFVYGIDAIKKGRLHTTALNLADRKIVEVHNLMRSLDPNDCITGDKLKAIFSNSNTIKYKGTDIAPTMSCKVWDKTNPNTDIHAEGTIPIKGTATYKYIFDLKNDPSNANNDIKKVRVEVSWVGYERKGTQSVILETLISRYHYNKYP